MSNQNNLQDWQVAYNVARGFSDVPYNESEVDENFILPSASNQEKELLRKEEFLTLSDEAKDVVRLILHSPADILKDLTTMKYGCISKDKIRKKLFTMGWKHRLIDKTFLELKKFTNNLSNY